jgi:hypothetical protein
LLTSRSDLNTFPRDGLLGCCFPFPFSALSLLFRDGDGEEEELASGRSISPPTLERRGKSWIGIVVVVVMVVIPGLTGAVSEETLRPPAAVNTDDDVDVDAAVDANADADTDDVNALGGPSA